MAETLRYRYKVGETLRYRLTVNMLVEEPGLAPMGARGNLESAQEVLAEHDDGTWTIELRSQAVELDGLLRDHLPQELLDRIAVVRIDPEGTLVDVDGESPPARIPTLPPHEVEEGAAWTVPDPASPVPLEVTYAVQSFEPVEDDVVAHLVSSAATHDAQEGAETSVDSTIDFSLAGGCILGSTTVIETAWRDGRKLSLVLENELQERGAPAASRRDTMEA